MRSWEKLHIKLFRMCSSREFLFFMLSSVYQDSLLCPVYHAVQYSSIRPYYANVAGEYICWFSESTIRVADKYRPAVMPLIDPSRDRYPYCLVWSPLPCISWFLPFIGHTGICDSNGVIHDFAGPYTIGVDNFTFGAPTRYIQLDPTKCCDAEWDAGVHIGCEVYKGRMHNLLFDNCHSHVARCLNAMSYDRKSNYGMVRIGVWFFFCGRFVSFSAFLKTYCPFLVIAIIALLVSGAIL